MYMRASLIFSFTVCHVPEDMKHITLLDLVLFSRLEIFKRRFYASSLLLTHKDKCIFVSVMIFATVFSVSFFISLVVRFMFFVDTLRASQNV